MTEPLIKTIRLKDNESIDLKELSYSLTRKNIMNGLKAVYRESDIVHFILESKIHDVDVNEMGELIFKSSEKKI
ncbi:hypothetical protein [Providencia stuartii]|uniref:hypothetical protein n=1 Tax=Providencia stuartii TaxID=588 RepID=UPI0024B0CCE3